MSDVNGGNQDVDIDIGRVIAAVGRRKGRILGATIAATALAVIGASLIAPSYKGEARLLIESRSPDLAAAGPQGNDPLLDTLNITSQAQILQSSDLITRVARELQLSKYDEFDPAPGNWFPDPLVLIGLKQDMATFEPEKRIIEQFREKLEVYPVEGSRVIAIEFSSHDPKLAAAIPNKMAEVYLDLQSDAKLDTHSDAAKWLEPEIESLRKKVQEAERKVADYRSSNGLFQTDDADSFSSRQLNDISAELARVRGERANAEARAENVRAALKAGRASDTLSDVVGSQVIQRLKEAEANLQAQISDQSISLLEGHPRLKGLRAQLGGIRQQIDSETEKILASLDNEAEVSRLRERQLMAQLNGLKADSARAGEEAVGLRALEREAAAQRQLLETYLARYREATSRLEANSSPADARVVSRAVEPSEAYFPKIVPIAVVVALATFLLGCLFVIVSELFSGRALRPSYPDQRRADEIPVAEREPLAEATSLRSDATIQESQEEIEEDAGEKVEAEIHEQIEEQQPAREVAIERPQPPAREPAVLAEPVEAIEPEEVAVPEKVVEPRKPVQAADDFEPALDIASVAGYLMRHAVPIAIGVSPLGDPGSAATVALAREVADSGRTVVLIDMTGSACPTRLMLKDQKLPGITDLLSGETAFGDALHRDRQSQAHIVPHGTFDPARAMQSIERLPMIIDALADAYDLVMIECGPAEISGIGRLTDKDKAEIVLSVPGFNEADIADLVIDFEKAGYSRLLVIAEPPHSRPSQGQGSRHAA